MKIYQGIFVSCAVTSILCLAQVESGEPVESTFNPHILVQQITEGIKHLPNAYVLQKDIEAVAESAMTMDDQVLKQYWLHLLQLASLAIRQLEAQHKVNKLGLTEDRFQIPKHNLKLKKAITEWEGIEKALLRETHLLADNFKKQVEELSKERGTDEHSGKYKALGHFTDELVKYMVSRRQLLDLEINKMVLTSSATALKPSHKLSLQLAEADNDLQTLLKSIEENLQEVVVAASIGADQGLLPRSVITFLQSL